MVNVKSDMSEVNNDSLHSVSTRLLCENCCEGKLIWKRKTRNVFGWILRIYKCNNCGLESRQEELPKNCKTIQVYP